MESDGSFFLKNLGKSSIFLNGKEIATGHAASLCSSSLIEVCCLIFICYIEICTVFYAVTMHFIDHQWYLQIREMAFVFEINHKSVRDYLANDNKRNQEKETDFKWSEGVP